MQTNELKYLLAILRYPKIGATRLKKLLNYFPTSKEAFNAHISELIEAGLDQKIAEEFDIKRKSISPDKELELFQKEKLNILVYQDKNYPEILNQSFNSPAILFYRGNIDLLRSNSIAVVGTRKYSNYGKQVLPEIIKPLVKHNLTIVSGLALGIDTLAHSNALNYNGKTIAVLGSSLDKANIYPTSNRYLADKILDQEGLLISEYPINTIPMKHHFPTRNRIISGLSLGTLVIEAGESSGALITAKYALEQNREVFAIPGPIQVETSKGTNNLIKQGAKPVCTVEDIFEELNIEKIEEYSENKKVLPSSPIEKKIIEILNSDPKHIDKIVKLTNLSPSEINSNLIIMEMKGMIKNLGNQNYVKS